MPPSGQSTTRSDRSRREGAVMLVVMLILLVATASAAVAVHTAQSELHAAGQDRQAMQTRYVSEAAIMTTTAWIDLLGYNEMFTKVWTDWEARPAPDLTVYGDPPLNPVDRHYATRTSEAEQLGLVKLLPTVQVPPLSLAVATGAGTGAPVDPAGVGSFGPRQAYGLPADATSGQFVGYMVDITDCVQTLAAQTPGEQLNTTSGQVPANFSCTLTARGRVVLPGNAVRRQWTFGGVTYNQDAFMSVADSRATIITPTMMVANQTQNH